MNKQTGYLSKPGMVCALGANREEISKQLFSDSPKGLKAEHKLHGTDDAPSGKVRTELPSTEHLPAPHRTRNNRLLLSAALQIQHDLNQAINRYGKSRIAVIVGTSTSGIAEAEEAISQKFKNGKWPNSFDYKQQEIGAPAQFLADHFELGGPSYTISTACSSGAKALASARRLLNANVCDAVICGGADSLCELTQQGFASLGAVSGEICQPFSQNRNGINIGEGACLFLMSREPSLIALAGVGESSDAHHISAPQPEGTGAEAAMRKALQDAGKNAADIDYLNLHGTGTEQNDKMESLATARVIGDQCPCSSTKALTGHTLGAAGALEAGFCYLSLEHNMLPAQLGDHQWDPNLPSLNWLKAVKKGSKVDNVMSNSFAFGGNNISLVLSKSLG
ncbi:beta-ketoacyl-[acyl-carrier-protein] synthase family protein [uncultured Pseudoteredinibacter sp.]|uniref:beta-ketoacyl-[acyl-carrier-protein] synthase family protein n=1 Tax=uncultured Pseudoteredinibacter sp. TaxID=1641701 RepID=UPI00260300A8|nr:beta-ketoacyl-[acyl-carrier-protein] synthase family protein [uncultured Pseudoteredinibacter sp.]